ncbi:MAG: hypothetical protein QOE65_2521 [Solirubrobacteraceae bacterium]|jgi:hypothetical protein|nr:hypothetical protein [Solirubrobacteraceae bacterium]
MSKLRKSRKTGAAAAVAKAVTVYNAAKPVAGAVKSFRRARAGKALGRRGKSRRPAVMLLGLLGIGAAAAAAKKRGGSDDLGYGPPNESHPSHETLAPSKAAAGQGTNGESAAASGGGEESSVAAGPPGDDAGTDEPGRE